MTIIDASTLVAYALREDKWEEAEAVLRERPHSVELLPIEAANAILMALRKGRVKAVEADEALHIVHGLADTGISLVPHLSLLSSAWEIACEQDLTLYDAVYLALARRERTSLASRDAAQIRAARGLGLRVVEA